MASKKPVDEEPQEVAAQHAADPGTPGEHEDPVKLLQDARRQAEDHWDKLLRAQAELENVRRRAERDLENAHKYALERFAGELLPVKDSLEMALAASNSDSDDMTRHTEGVELTLKMLSSVLEKFGITEINPVSEPFDPEYHQAMSMQATDQQPADTVISVMQKGYLLNERLLRPAMVVVAKAPEE